MVLKSNIYHFTQLSEVTKLMELTKLTTIPGSEKNISMTNVDNFERSDNFYNSLTPKKLSTCETIVLLVFNI